MMLYFGQELGERGMEREGFSGMDGRTTIFDYWRVPSVQEWYGGGKCCSRHINAEAARLREQYRKIIALANAESFVSGKFYDLMYVNTDNPHLDHQRIFAFMRAAGDERYLVVCNFSDREGDVGVNIPQHALGFLGIDEGSHPARDVLSGRRFTLALSARRQAVVRVGAWSAAVTKF